MNSSHECEQKISTDGHMESVLCHEVHLFKPFSQGDSGAMTEVTQKLTFVSKSTGTTTRMGMTNDNFSELESNEKQLCWIMFVPGFINLHGFCKIKFQACVNDKK